MAAFEEHHAAVRGAFFKADADKDGRVTESEFCSAVSCTARALPAICN